MDFIQKYAKVDGTDDADDDLSVAGGDEVNDSDVDFIDDTIQDQDALNYRLMNVIRDLQEALLDQSMTTDLGECSDPETFVPDLMDEIENEYDNFETYRKIENDLQLFKLNSKDLFISQYYMVLFKVSFRKGRF